MDHSDTGDEQVRSGGPWISPVFPFSVRLFDRSFYNTILKASQIPEVGSHPTLLGAAPSSGVTSRARLLVTAGVLLSLRLDVLVLVTPCLAAPPPSVSILSNSRILCLSIWFSLVKVAVSAW